MADDTNQDVYLLFLLALQILVSFGLLKNCLSYLSVHSHLIPILNLHFFRILFDIILPSYPRSTSSSYYNWSLLCYSFHRPFFIHSYNMPSRSYSVCSYIRKTCTGISFTLYSLACFAVTSFSLTLLLPTDAHNVKKHRVIKTF